MFSVEKVETAVGDPTYSRANSWWVSKQVSWAKELCSPKHWILTVYESTLDFTALASEMTF